MVNNFLAPKIQSVLNYFGYEMRRKNVGVSYTDPYVEQARILSAHNVKVIFEVGAADGRDCLRYSHLFPYAEVFAFEPLPNSFTKLQAACRENPRVHSFQRAMSHTPGNATLHIGGFEEASSLYKAKKTGSTFDKYNASQAEVEVLVDTISSFSKCQGISQIDLLKMDAQGAELDILNGAGEFVDDGLIPVIYTEVQFTQLYEGVPQFDKIMTHLLERGYYLHNLYDLVSNQAGQLAWGDAIFIRLK